MKRRIATIAIATGLLAAGGSFAAQASASSSPLGLRQDTSGCIVLLPDLPNPITICLFPR